MLTPEEQQAEWAKRREGMRLAYEASPEEWRPVAVEALFRTALAKPLFQGGDVWEFFPPEYSRKHRTRALGAVMKLGEKNGWIAKSGGYALHPDYASACKQQIVWRSLIYGDPDLT